MRPSTVLTIVAEQLDDVAMSTTNEDQKKEAERLRDLINDSIPRVVDLELKDSANAYKKIIEGFQAACKAAGVADAELKKIAKWGATAAEVVDTAVKIIAALGPFLA